MTGVLALAVALLAPLESSLSAHMAQHLLLGLVAPLLLAAGAPVRLALAASRRRRWVRALHALPLRPAVGWAAFTAVMLGTHLTGWYELALENPFVHALEHLAYLLAGSRVLDPARRRRPAPARARPGRAAGVAARGDAADGPGRRAPADRDGRLSVLPGSRRPALGRGPDVGHGIAADVGGAGGDRVRRPAARGAPAAATRGGRAMKRAAHVLAALICAGAATAIWASPPTATAQQSGRALFASACSTCHGPDARGVAGKGPSLVGVGAAAADFYLETGRMPLSDPSAEPVRGEPAFTRTERRALTDYIASLGGPPVPTVRPRRRARRLQGASATTARAVTRSRRAAAWRRPAPRPRCSRRRRRRSPRPSASVPT